MRQYAQFHAFVVGVERGPDFPALIRITQELIDGFLQRIFNAGTLELRHAHRNAIHEQHRVRNNVPAPAGQFYLELVDDKEVVVERIFEIDEPHRLVAPGVPIRQAVNLRSLEQQFRGRFVDFHQTMALGPLQFLDDPADAIVVEPRPAVSQIQFVERRRKPAFEQHLAEVLPLREIGNVRVALNPLPAHRLKLLAKRLLDEIVFPLDLAHGFPVPAAVYQVPLGTGPALLENMVMEMEVISIRVDSETAKTFRSLPEEDRRKLEALLSIRLSEVSRLGESLDTVMKEIAEKAKARGLTPEILKSLLDEE